MTAPVPLAAAHSQRTGPAVTSFTSFNSAAGLLLLCHKSQSALFHSQGGHDFPVFLLEVKRNFLINNGERSESASQAGDKHCQEPQVIAALHAKRAALSVTKLYSAMQVHTPMAVPSHGVLVHKIPRGVVGLPGAWQPWPGRRHVPPHQKPQPARPRSVWRSQGP